MTEADQVDLVESSGSGAHGGQPLDSEASHVAVANGVPRLMIALAVLAAIVAVIGLSRRDDGATPSADELSASSTVPPTSAAPTTEAPVTTTTIRRTTTTVPEAPKTLTLEPVEGLPDDLVEARVLIVSPPSRWARVVDFGTWTVESVDLFGGPLSGTFDEIAPLGDLGVLVRDNSGGSGVVPWTFDRTIPLDGENYSGAAFDGDTVWYISQAFDGNHAQLMATSLTSLTTKIRDMPVWSRVIAASSERIAVQVIDQIFILDHRGEVIQTLPVGSALFGGIGWFVAYGCDVDLTCSTRIVDLDVLEWSALEFPAGDLFGFWSGMGRLSASGRRMAISMFDVPTVVVIDADTNTLVETGLETDGRSVAFTPSGEQLLLFENGALLLHDLATETTTELGSINGVANSTLLLVPDDWIMPGTTQP